MVRDGGGSAPTSLLAHAPRGVLRAVTVTIGGLAQGARGEDAGSQPPAFSQRSLIPQLVGARCPLTGSRAHGLLGWGDSQIMTHEWLRPGNGYMDPRQQGWRFPIKGSRPNDTTLEGPSGTWCGVPSALRSPCYGPLVKSLPTEHVQNSSRSTNHVTQ